MKIVLFTDSWYTECIAQVVEGFSPKTSPDAVAISRSIMIAGAFIGQAIDNSIGASAQTLDKNTLLRAISEIAASLDDLARKQEAVDSND